MRLHEFMAAERDALLAGCAAKLRDRAPDRSSDEVLAELPAFVDEVIAVLRGEISPQDEEAAIAQGTGPAAELGRQSKQVGFDVALTVLSLGVVSDSIGELGSKAGLSFEASDYRRFNQCLDSAMASALTQYWKLDREQPNNDSAVQLAFFAHELRNSLSSVQMAWNFLLQGHAGLHGRTANLLDRNLKRALELIGHTLVGAQLNAGAPLSRSPVNLARMLLDIQAAAVLERNVSVSVHADAALEVLGDEKILVSAISNLVQNAIKFTHDNGAVHVRALKRDGDVEVEVEDECGGLPPGDPERLFEPFVRGSQPRSTGIGLAIARRAARAHGGEIYVQDRPGKGCVFSIRLPAGEPSH